MKIFLKPVRNTNTATANHHLIEKKKPDKI